jgi:dynein heavy chain, axonemal
VQDIIDSKLDKRRKGVFGPPVGRRAVVFVDDLNMLQVEQYGAQPPIELLRQHMDHEGWYDRKELTFRRLVDIQFAAAMAPPVGGRNAVTNRYVRHFSTVRVHALCRQAPVPRRLTSSHGMHAIRLTAAARARRSYPARSERSFAVQINLTEFGDASKRTIFCTLVDWWLHKAAYGDDVRRLGPKLVEASLQVYAESLRALLPTPTRSHYTFNLRDLSKTFQGMARAGSSLPGPDGAVRLWAHETLRVFSDRLINAGDRAWFAGALRKAAEEHCRIKWRAPRCCTRCQPQGAAHRPECLCCRRVHRMLPYAKQRAQGG